MGTGAPTTVAWEKQSISLSAHIGKTITVTFQFYATTSVQQAGWYLDDISVASSPL